MRVIFLLISLVVRCITLSQTVYTCDLGGYVTKWQASDGSMVWRNASTYIQGSTTYDPTRLSASGPYCYVIYGERYLGRLRSSDGQRDWLVDAGYTVTSPLTTTYLVKDVATDGTYVYTCNTDGDGYITKWNASDGSMVSRNISTYVQGSTTWLPTRLSASGSYCYVIYGDRYLGRMHTSDGQRDWLVDAGYTVTSPLAITYLVKDVATDGTYVYTCNTDPDGYVTRWSASDGSMGWRIISNYPQGSTTNLPVNLSANALYSYVTYGNRYLGQLRSSDGAHLWLVDAGNTIGSTTWLAQDVGSAIEPPGTAFTIDFGTVLAGTTSVSGGWEFAGGAWDGQQILMQSEAITGPDAGDFSVNTNYTGRTLTYGQNFYFSASFTPSRVGVESADILASEGPCPPMCPFLVHLTGTAVPIVVTAQPQSQTVVTGAVLRLSIAASGAQPIGYQWKLNGTTLTNGDRISGSQSNIVTIAPVSLRDSGNYQVILTNTYGSTTSAVAVVLVGSVGVPITTLFNTGVGASGAPATNGTVSRLHYTLVSVPSSSTTNISVRTAVGGYPIGPWIGDDNKSAWIGPANDSSLDGPGGQYDYQTTFSITGADPGTVFITGQYAVDDALVGIYLNGHFTGIANPNPGGPLFTQWQPFMISGSTNVVYGTNTLDFVVNNGSGPTGLRVEMTGLALALRILPPQISGGSLTFSFAAVPNQSYTLWCSTNLAATDWDICTNLTASGSLIQVALPIGNNLVRQYYRVSVP